MAGRFNGHRVYPWLWERPRRACCPHGARLTAVETYQGLHGAWLDGVFFTEETGDSACLVTAKPLVVEISRQNSDLRQVKIRLAKEVKRQGGNALVGFQYGQRSHPVWKQFFTFSWDTESWHGRGLVAKI